MTPFQKVAVGINFSDSSNGALALARSSFPGAVLRLIHVQTDHTTDVPDITTGGAIPVLTSPSVVRQTSDNNEKLLDALSNDGEEEEIVVGDAVKQLIQASQEWGAELIVVGTHKQGFLAHALSGSVAEQLAKQSPIPVLVVPHAQKQKS